MQRFLIPAFLCLTATDESAATERVCSLQATTLRTGDPTEPRLYLDDTLPTVTIPADCPLDADPQSMTELDGFGTGDEQDKLLDVIVQMRADVGPLVNAARAFLDAPHGGSGVRQMAEVNRARAQLESSLTPFLAPDSPLLGELGTQAPAESTQEAVTAAVTLTDEVITTTLRLSDEFCADVLCTAFEGGTGYWAVLDKIETTTVDGDLRYVRAEMSDTEAEEGDEPAFAPFICDYALVRKGVAKALGTEPGIRVDIVDAIHQGATQNDSGCIDADAADCIVQLGAFNELTFG